MPDGKIRMERKGGFTVLNNELLRDERLSLKTKGLFAVLSSLPADWEYNISGLCEVTHTGRDAIRSALAEMESAGYLHRTKRRTADGKFDCEYIITDSPSSRDGFPDADKPSTENPTEQNKEINNTPIVPSGDKPAKRQKSTPKHRPELFERVWSSYPNGANRVAAVRAWDKLKPSDELVATILRDIAVKKRGRQWQQGFIPHMSTYINQERWTDRQEPATGYAPQAAAEPFEPIVDTGGFRPL